MGRKLTGKEVKKKKAVDSKKSGGLESTSFDKVLRFFQGVSDQSKMDLLFRVFFTEKEKQMISDRYQILEALLLTEMSQREISSQYQISISKITAGSKETQRLSPTDKDFIAQRMNKIHSS